MLFIQLLLTPLNLLLGTLILLEDYQIQILENLWRTIWWGGSKRQEQVAWCSKYKKFFETKSFFNIIPCHFEVRWEKGLPLCNPADSRLYIICVEMKVLIFVFIKRIYIRLPKAIKRPTLQLHRFIDLKCHLRDTQYVYGI